MTSAAFSTFAVAFSSDPPQATKLAAVKPTNASFPHIFIVLIVYP
jgi:hypothetical protein